MIRKKENVVKTRKPAPFHGTGEICVRDILEGPEEMYNQGRVFAHTTVYPGSAIGYHVHENESETYYILKGRAKFNDNGTQRILYPGDVAFTGSGEGHGIEAMEEPVEMIALILYGKGPAL